MTSEVNQGAKRWRRRRVFVDMSLQGWLLVALVVLEVALLAGACWYLYGAFNAIIEESLYFIHGASKHQLLPQFAREIGVVLLVCAFINTVALFAAHGFWVLHVRQILGEFSLRLHKLKTLDLSMPTGGGADKHRLLEIYDIWLALERARASKVGVAISEAREHAQGTGDDAKERAITALAVASKVLSHHQE